uniref:Uncharacterized protein n=1 Tax=Phlebotomus papatasi TaxID=29031 RepID=A0A1B0DBC4_PHLPP
TIRVCQAEQCGQEELARCSRPLQVLSSTSDLTIATNKEELNEICPDLYGGLHCIRSYTRRCMSLQHRNHFNKLYHGTNQVIRDLCREGHYQNGEFLDFFPPTPIPIFFHGQLPYSESLRKLRGQSTSCKKTLTTLRSFFKN